MNLLVISQKTADLQNSVAFHVLFVVVGFDSR